MVVVDLLERDACLTLNERGHEAPHLAFTLKLLTALLETGIQRGKFLPEGFHAALEETIGHEELTCHILLTQFVPCLTAQDDEFTDDILAREVDAGVRFAVSLLLGHLHGTAEGNVLANLVEDEVQRTAQHGFNAQNLVAGIAEVVDGTDDGESGSHVGLEEKFHATLLGDGLEFAIVVIVAAGSYLVGGHHIDVMAQEILVETRHLG